ncbi:acyltransferase domain-containing protein [Chondromyces apiculatus]|uniref:Malonyl CoA-acyl carrier protein transacylase n=1 Tax=Chondromyces apiculatus DSM 436 TaxID=1192034 RepID=A0A017T5T7_9BACT|nr:acyltransferase domain-containing protein [Chondromyces apiculatus]EYF04554.1 Malonyl CoA-acyl carrier protein transacylase [Chondromyces apiculatus DSM 436]
MGPAKTVFMFSGLGSQYHQMGRELFEQDAVFNRWLLHYDSFVTGTGGASVIPEIYAPERQRGNAFSDLKRAAAALLVVECALARSLMEAGVVPDLLLGASLGEYAAGILAEALDFGEILQVFHQQLDVLREACARATLVGVFHSFAWVASTPLLRERCEISAYNFEGCVALTLRERDWEEVRRCLIAHDVVHQVVPVDQGFHSSLVEPAEGGVRRAMQGLQRRSLAMPVLSCATNRRVIAFDDDHLWGVLRKPIGFQRTIEALEREGKHVYVDVGPSGTLAGYTKHVLGRASAARVFPVLSIFGRDVHNLSKLLSQHRGALEDAAWRAPA